MTGLLLLFIGTGALYGLYWFLIARFHVSTDDAYVHGNQMALMAQVGGTVIAVNADNTDRVRQGQELVLLDPSDARIALDQAKAKLAQTVRAIHQLHLQYAEQQAVIAAQRAQLAQSRSDYERSKSLNARNAISEEQFQHARTAWHMAQAQLQQAEHGLASLQVQIGVTDLRHHPDVKQAVAALRAAWLDHERTTVVAPMSGYIAKRSVQPGQQIRPGEPLMAVVPLAHVWVQANFKETELGRMRIGQPATITADFYGDSVTYHGTVVGISPGTGSVFELLPPQNATGNWIKVVQRVPVRIAIDQDQLQKHPLRLGLSLQVSVDVHDTDGEVLTQQAVSGPLYRTAVYERQLDGLQALIMRIIEDNGGNIGPAATEIDA